jgi:hypothetical protein
MLVSRPDWYGMADALLRRMLPSRDISRATRVIGNSRLTVATISTVAMG